jgi:ABC-type glycerol-3-phosphate transport system substrate-binding protein
MVLKEEALLRMLTFHSQAQNAGVFRPAALDMANLDDSWDALSQGTAQIANVSARQYLANHDTALNAGYAPLPGWNQPALSIAPGWAFAIVTSNPARQRAAAELIAWLCRPENQGNWTQATGWLPTAPKAWESWSGTPYQQFLDGQLATALSYPTGSTYPQTAAQLRKGVLSVLRDGATPAQAATTAMNQPTSR